MLLAASFMLAYWVIRHKPHIEHEIRIIGPLQYPLAIAVFALVASAPFSMTDALAIMNGAILGRWTAPSWTPLDWFLLPCWGIG